MSDSLLLQALESFLAFSPGPQEEVRVFFAPGRVNLIGEHLDYNGGYVLPAALTQGIWLFVRPRRDNHARFRSLHYERAVDVRLSQLTYDRRDDFANYPKGVLWAFAEKGLTIQGGDYFFAGNLPSQAGLSSSAALEMVTAFAVNKLVGDPLSLTQLALLAQSAENRFVGVNCGIMDQFAVGLGKSGHALLLQTASLQYEHIPFLAEGIQIVITNTNKRRELTDSKYNERRKQCDELLKQVQQVEPYVRGLADVTEAMWETIAPRLHDAILVKRGRHVVLENARVIAAAAALRNKNLPLFGSLMNASHESLREDYEVTGRELDALATAAWEAPGCIGSRMTGAGFGGCTVSLVETGAVDTFQRAVHESYLQSVGLEPSFYVSDFGDGVREVTEEVFALWQC
ncbi:galactokinase [Sulfoacidibacillus thermotolerans]|uniref:Galactokinase n=1 Tax=Sulfoacidibacillus thermotolerans TaxID=1765684 RepID=A0A2U3DB28_SULT2|nr:galactokinase [Sulfoacidibacillus thermotolerans]PWI58487.1 galactokinase [Sulfoacidibacillus thermotolerans]